MFLANFCSMDVSKVIWKISEEKSSEITLTDIPTRSSIIGITKNVFDKSSN